MNDLTGFTICLAIGIFGVCFFLTGTAENVYLRLKDRRANAKPFYQEGESA